MESKRRKTEEFPAEGSGDSGAMDSTELSVDGGGDANDISEIYSNSDDEDLDDDARKLKEHPHEVASVKPSTDAKEVHFKPEGHPHEVSGVKPITNAKEVHFKREEHLHEFAGVKPSTNAKEVHFRGVRKRARRSVRQYVAEIRLPGKRTRVSLGYFDTAEEAAKRYDTAIREFHGPKARTNFPMEINVENKADPFHTIKLNEHPHEVASVKPSTDAKEVHFKLEGHPHEVASVKPSTDAKEVHFKLEGHPHEVSGIKPITNDKEVHFRGVRKRMGRSEQQYVAEIRRPGKRSRVWLGYFDTAEEAAKRYDTAIREFHGPKARTNFPMEINVENKADPFHTIKLKEHPHEVASVKPSTDAKEVHFKPEGHPHEVSGVKPITNAKEVHFKQEEHPHEFAGVKPSTNAKEVHFKREKHPDVVVGVKPSTNAMEVHFRGVRYTSEGKYGAEIRRPGSRTRFWLGYFDTAEEAAKRYDTVAKEFHGPKVQTNFPMEINVENKGRYDTVAKEFHGPKVQTNFPMEINVENKADPFHTIKLKEHPHEVASVKPSTDAKEVHFKLEGHPQEVSGVKPITNAKEVHFKQEEHPQEFAGIKPSTNAKEVHFKQEKHPHVVVGVKPSTNAKEVRFRGVRYTSQGKYGAEIRRPGSRTRFWLGYFDTAEEAAKRYDTVAREFHGPKAQTNFPMEINVENKVDPFHTIYKHSS